MLESNSNANRGMAGDFTLHTLILTAMLLFMLASFAFGASGDFGFCYQETANVSTSCGGLATGNYTNNGSFFDPGFSEVYPYDGDYDTFGTAINGSTTISASVNYSKNNMLNDSLWRVKIGSPAGGQLNTNLTIQSSCWTYNDSNLQLRLRETNWNSAAECFNGSWITLGTAAKGLWEEAMYWSMNNTTITITPTPTQVIATKNNLVKWNDTVTIIGGSGTCLYNITQLGVQNNTTISIAGNSSLTNNGNYTNLNWSCNSTSSPFNITFYTEAPNETTSTVSYAGLGGVQTRFYINTTFNNSLNYSLITNASTVQGLRVWKCDALVNATCNASASWSEQMSYTLSGTTVNYTYNMNSNESVVIVSWDVIGGGGGLIGGGGGGIVQYINVTEPPAPTGELPAIPGTAPFGEAIDKFLRGASFGIPNAWLAIVVLLLFIAEGTPRYFAGRSSGLLTVLSLFGIALIGFYYKSTLGLGI